MLPVRQRILQRTAATITYQCRGSDGEAVTTDPGTVTVTITRADGTVLYPDAATTDTAGLVSYSLTAVDTALLDVLTAVWEVSNVTVGQTSHDVVGDYYFTITELRAAHREVADPTAYPLADLVKHRDETETSFESWTNMAWVPRLSVIEQPPGRTVFGPMAVRTVRWGRISYTGSVTDLTADQLALVSFTDYVHNSFWPWYGTSTFGVEHGQDAPPADLKRVAMRYCAQLATSKESGLSPRAQSYQTPEGQLVNLGRIGTEWRPTGDEIIDEVLRRHDIDHRLTAVG